ncbi:T9SS type A sorting domain-containing protein [Cytophagaceae bacterium ABcell3]|nr:T9SS type A sorting domain-containing protein [Cytophagaceae bacterium ABcell3]
MKQLNLLLFYFFWGASIVNAQTFTTQAAYGNYNATGMALLEDFLWTSTPHGIEKRDLSGNLISRYTSEDGLGSSDVFYWIGVNNAGDVIANSETNLAIYQNNIWETINYPGNTALNTDFKLDSSNNLYAFHRDTLWKYDNTEWTYLNLKEDVEIVSEHEFSGDTSNILRNFRNFAIDNEGRLWGSGCEQFRWMLDFESSRLKLLGKECTVNNQNSSKVDITANGQKIIVSDSLYIYDQSGENLSHIQDLNNKRYIHADEQNRLWFLHGQSFYIYDQNEWTEQTVEFPAENLSSFNPGQLLIDSKGTQWLSIRGATQSRLYRISEGAATKINYEDQASKCYIENQLEGVGLRRTALNIWKDDTEKLWYQHAHHLYSTGNNCSNVILMHELADRNLASDKDGNIYALSGAYIYHPVRRNEAWKTSISKYTPDGEEEELIKENLGHSWFHFNTAERHILKKNSLNRTENGHLWFIVSYDSLVSLGRGGTFYHTIEALVQFDGTSFQTHPLKIKQEEIDLYNVSGQGVTLANILNEPESSITKDKQDNIWVSTSDKLIRYENGLKKEKFNYPEGISILNIHCDYRGRIWGKTDEQNSQVVCFDGEKWELFDANDFDVKYEMRKDSSFAIVIERDNGFHYTKDGDQWTHYTKADGLFSNRITNHVTDSTGNIWFGHGNGITIMDQKADQPTFASLPEDDLQEEIILYPNPAYNTISLKGATPDSKLVICNIDGRISEILPFKENIDISHLSKGMYILRIESAEKVVTRQFVKQ